MKPMLTSVEVCELLKVSASTLSRMVKHNRIPYVLVGKGKVKASVRFVEAHLDKWLERRSRGPVPKFTDPRRREQEESETCSEKEVTCST
jgi:excisionase family DNA binding protein